jgi:hypothetical protein
MWAFMDMGVYIGKGWAVARYVSVVFRVGFELIMMFAYREALGFFCRLRE